MPPSTARSLQSLAAHVGGELLGPSIDITGVSSLEQAQPGELAFYGSRRYRKAFDATRASAVLVGAEAASHPRAVCVRVSNPALAFARLAALFHPAPKFAPGISRRANVHPEAHVHPEATVMALATVEKGARIGARTVLFPGTYVGEWAVIGEDTYVASNVTVGERCVVGSRVTIHASAVLGADGFGFVFDPEVPQHVKVPQTGIVRVEDDVEIGASSCIDRATFGETVIGRGTKIDNLVQIAHNVKVGPLAILCSQVGIAGSAEIGTGVVLAGQVGVVGHLRVGDLAQVAAQSGIGHDVPDGAKVGGSPAFEHQAWLKSTAMNRRLGEWPREMQSLLRRVEALEKEGQKG